MAQTTRNTNGMAGINVTALKNAIAAARSAIATNNIIHAADLNAIVVFGILLILITIQHQTYMVSMIMVIPILLDMVADSIKQTIVELWRHMDLII